MRVYNSIPDPAKIMMLQSNIITREEFGKWYIGSKVRRKRNKLFRHLEKFEKGYRRKK